jgi:hypothetical protein
VLVSAREGVRATWTGVGYVIQDPDTGAEAYLIQGGLRGGEEDPCREDSLEPDTQPIHSIIFSLTLFILFVALILATVASLPALALAAVGGVALMLDVAPAVAWPVPTTVEGLWNAQYTPRYGPLPTQPPYPGQGIEPPGACTTDELNSLHSWQKEKCAQPGIRGRADPVEFVVHTIEALIPPWVSRCGKP